MKPATATLADAHSLLRQGHAQEALEILEHAVAGSTSVGPAHSLYLEALIGLGRRRDALAAHDRALRLPADSPDAVDALAFFALQLDRHELSNALYRRATELAPGDAQFWYNLATSERSLGRLSDAETACERALALDPSYRPAILLRSEVSRATSAANHVDELVARIAAAAESPDVMFLHYALGKELHELGEYDQAFAAFAQGASARRRTLSYSVAQDVAKLKRIAEVYPTAAAMRPEGQIGRHIFIVGLPRTGTTLAERILGGLAHVRSNGETNNFSLALFGSAPRDGGDAFERAARSDDTAVAVAYDDLAVPDGFAGKVIEKLPFNYLYIGAILRAFPTTPIVVMRRNPLDTCFAMFRTLFAAAYPFSYDFGELARYYAAYTRLMAHWEGLFSGRITWVDYEGLVAAPHEVAPQLAARCGLPWRDAALDIARNASVSLTASAAQVRGGIYGSSSGIWRKYQRHLEPLADQLRACGVNVP